MKKNATNNNKFFNFNFLNIFSAMRNKKEAIEHFFSYMKSCGFEVQEYIINREKQSANQLAFQISARDSKTSLSLFISKNDENQFVISQTLGGKNMRDNDIRIHIKENNKPSQEKQQLINKNVVSPQRTMKVKY